MVQGTTSDAGKSFLVAAICRVLANRGVKVAPFKSQNMALNSAVTKDGGEIGRAQAVQAQAARAEPSVHMNPILLKPCTDTGAQVIVQGKALTDMDAIGYHGYKAVAMGPVMESFSKLRDEYQTIIIEGAGSPAEINLRENDIANMGFAEEADVPVVIIADIDKGGVFAHLVGTLDLLSKSEQERVVGFVINRFRGDIKLLEPGLDWLEKRTGKPVIGVVPYLHGLSLEAEDAIDGQQVLADEGTKLNVVVPVVPRISNHTDFDALRLHPDVNLMYVGPGETPPSCDLIILPGSKSVRADLDFLKKEGWEGHLKRHIRYGGKVMGICGGYQMLGEHISDPYGVEGSAGESQGFGLLSCSTILETEKQLTNMTGVLSLCGKKVPVKGYEIHVGITSGNDIAPLDLEGKEDGAISCDEMVFGTYLHGVFDVPDALKLILEWAGMTDAKFVDVTASRDEQIERIAAAVEAHLDLDRLFN